MAQAISKKETTQTAVEWLIEQFEKNGYIGLQAEKQAKAMEKEQMIKAWMATDNELQRIAAEQYYNETYGNTNSN